MVTQADFDPWAVLGVAPGAPSAEVRAAWKRLALQYHPDRFATAPAADRQRAAAHMTAVNIAYDEIRSGRATRTAASAFGAGYAGAGTAAGRQDHGGGGASADPSSAFGAEGWLDDALLAEALRRGEQRVRGHRRRRRLRLVAFALAVVALGGLLHLALLRPYHYDLVIDGRGNRYTDVDCVNGYDRGATAAAAIRARAATSPDREELLHQAEVIEYVCSSWTNDLERLAVPALLLGAGAVWLVFFRTGRS